MNRLRWTDAHTDSGRGGHYFKLFQSEKTNKTKQNTGLLAFKKTNQKGMNAFECGQDKNNANFQRRLPLMHRYKTKIKHLAECTCC